MKANKTVLVVDDAPTVRRLRELSISRAGYEVIAAPGSAEGLELARTRRPDYIMLSITTPRMEGYAMLHAVKTNPETAGVPVVMVTARDRDEDIFEGWLAGVSAYITAPVDLEDLLLIFRRIESFRNAA